MNAKNLHVVLDNGTDLFAVDIFGNVCTNIPNIVSKTAYTNKWLIRVGEFKSGTKAGQTRKSYVKLMNIYTMFLNTLYINTNKDNITGQWNTEIDKALNSTPSFSPTNNSSDLTTDPDPVATTELDSVPVTDEVDITINDRYTPEELADLKYIHNSYSLKPHFLKISELKWKLLVRNVLREKNIMLLGPSGEGKTVTVQTLANSLGRELYTFNFGNMQDAQTALLGKTHYNVDSGTYFSESTFIKAIKTENAIILCDEITRASHDAMNIMIPVFDPNQRFIRLLDDPNSPIIEVAKGVSFIATANVGREYSATNELDWAISTRFTKLEMDILTNEERISLLTEFYPNVPSYLIKTIIIIARDIYENVISENPSVSIGLSTRSLLDMAGIVNDGFTILDACESVLFPNYSMEGGTESERTFVIQAIQKHTNIKESLFKLA